MSIIDLESNAAITTTGPLYLPTQGSWPNSVHEFDTDSIWALRAAIAAQRPLLIKGKPGCGKSQLARAAAVAMKRTFFSEVVHARMEAQDLLWRYDAVARLGEAQAMAGHTDAESFRQHMDPARFLEPGVLWWAFCPDTARDQAKKCFKQSPLRPCSDDAANGVVVLIDEIDKADTDLPNGLLEALGNGAFPVPHVNQTVRANPDKPPLVIITTNEERQLPDAFTRRCLVLELKLPETQAELIQFLTKRGAHHRGDTVGELVRKKAAELLAMNRKAAQQAGLPAPGLAEYLDLLRALANLSSAETEQITALGAIAKFAFQKNSTV